jgi:hypothetical protein
MRGRAPGWVHDVSVQGGAELGVGVRTHFESTQRGTDVHIVPKVEKLKILNIGLSLGEICSDMSILQEKSSNFSK